MTCDTVKLSRQNRKAGVTLFSMNKITQTFTPTHSHPNQHIGLVVLWVKLRQRGYTRSVSGLYRVLTRTGQMAVKLPIYSH